MSSSNARTRDPDENRNTDLRLGDSVRAPEFRPAPSIRFGTRERVETVGFFIDFPEVLEALTGQQMRLSQSRIEEERVRTRSWIQKFGIVMLSMLMMLGIAIVMLQAVGVAHLSAGLIKSIVFAVIVPAGLIARWTFRDLFPGGHRK